MLGGQDSRAPGRLDEELDHEAVAVTGRCAFERRAVAQSDRRLHGAAHEQASEIEIDLRGRDVRGEHAGQRRPIASVQRLIEPAQQRRDRVGFRRLS